MRGADQFHVGIVVDDLHAALAELTELFGYEWCAQTSGELIQSVPGTPWVPAPSSGLHHAGYWSDDTAADAALLVSRGYAEEARGLDADGSPA